MALKASTAQADPETVIDDPKTPRGITEEGKSLLIALDKKHNLTPTDVVEAAKDPKSPIHHHFCWDDTEAAHRYRIQQARSLIVSVRTIITTVDGGTVVPVFVRDTTREPSEQGYTSIAGIKPKSKQARSLLLYEVGRALSILQRATSIADQLGENGELSKLVKAAERYKRHLEK